VDTMWAPRRLGTALVAVLAVSSCATGSGGDPTPTSSRSASPSGFAKVEVDGAELAYECRGEGSPTIIAEAGYDTGGTTAFAGLLDPLSGVSRVCTYDRFGTGNSDPRPAALAKGLTSDDEARELHDLLDAAGIGAPFVVVAHSYGGIVARLFAADFRADVQGLVLIESSHEDEIAAYRRYYGDDPDGDWVDGGDLLDMRTTADLLRSRARRYGDLPLVVIRAETYEDVLSESLWRRSQADLATLSTDTMLIEALDSGHFVIDENPGVVVAATGAVVDAALSGRRLPPCEEVIADVDARCLPS
jgi:pimeloyl-ACP methyl ester carboxylesterase